MRENGPEVVADRSNRRLITSSERASNIVQPSPPQEIKRTRIERAFNSSSFSK
jgi:hypothetical protein